MVMAARRAAGPSDRWEHVTVGGGGSVAVASAELYSRMRRLDEVAAALYALSREVAAVDGRLSSAALTSADAPLSAARAERALDEAALRLATAALSSESLAVALRAGATSYGLVEEGAIRAAQALAADVGTRLGFAMTALRPILLPGVLFAAAAAASGVAVARALDPTGTERSLQRHGKWFEERRGALSDPLFVELVRFSVMSADDAMAGAAGLPPPLVRAIGDDGLGLVGVDTAAAVIVGAAGVAGVLRETPVRLSAGAPTASSVPTGLAGRAERVPEKPAQVRVDRIVQHGRPDRFEVYIAGTRDFDPAAGSEPWDLTSNVNAIAGADAASYRAVVEALAASGVSPDSPVVVTGYSQGGLVGAMLAASGDYRVEALYTLGAPAGQVPVPDSVPWIAVEHTDDVVPALGGTWSSSDPLLVRREAFADRPLDESYLFPAHQLEYYRETAAIADRVDEQRVVEAGARLDAFVAGADAVESTLYTAERAPRARG